MFLKRSTHHRRFRAVIIVLVLISLSACFALDPVLSRLDTSFYLTIGLLLVALLLFLRRYVYIASVEQRSKASQGLPATIEMPWFEIHSPDLFVGPVAFTADILQSGLVETSN